MGNRCVKVSVILAAHQFSWTQYPTIWFAEYCAILWLVLRALRSPWARTGVLLMLSGLMANALVTAANAGTMPVVGMPNTWHPASPMWRPATSHTRLSLLADQVWLGLFSIGDLVMPVGGLLIIAICLRRTSLWKAATLSVRPFLKPWLSFAATDNSERPMPHTEVKRGDAGDLETRERVSRPPILALIGLLVVCFVLGAGVYVLMVYLR